MRILLASLLIALAACSSTAEEPAGTADAAPDAAADPYPYACCPFADEGLTEFDACCAAWRADGGR